MAVDFIVILHIVGCNDRFTFEDDKAERLT